MNKSFRKLNVALFCFTLIALQTKAQQGIAPSELGGGKLELNTITTSVPFLLISPDARGGGMGDVGAATSPDANSIHWNPAKLAFIEKNAGLSLNYTPWLRNLVPDISLMYLSGFKRIDDKSTFGGALRYFSLGNIQFTNINGENIGQFTPNEFSIDGAYSRKLSDYFSTGIALRYIYSNLAAGLDPNNQTRPGQSVAGDISFYFNKPVKLKKTKAELGVGLNMSNIGAKIAYTESGVANFLPTNMRLGTQLKLNIDQYNAIAFVLELNKLMVPTPQYEYTDTTRTFRRFISQDDISVIEGIFRSFNDAPLGFREELHEINYSIGFEYIYDKQFAVRGGFFNEHITKGGRQYFTMGAGLKWNVFDLDFAYVIPTARLQNSPLQNTLRFSLSFGLDALKSGNKTSKNNTAIED